MNTRLAVVAGAATVALVALGGTALALSSGAPAPSATAAATSPTATSSTATSPTATSSTATATREAPAPQPSGVGLGADEAAAIALERVGGGRVDEIEREFEHGRDEWKVEVVHAGAEHDVRVDALTGAITRYEVDDDVSGGDRDRGERGHY